MKNKNKILKKGIERHPFTLKDCSMPNGKTMKAHKTP